MQGAILCQDGTLDPAVINNIKTVRQSFSDAELIISTWNVSNDIRCEMDTLSERYSLLILYNEDPGAISSIDGVVSSNVNRMILSTKNGVEVSNGEFVIKIRTDSNLYNDNIRCILSHLMGSRINKKRNNNYKIFENYVINCNLFARDVRGYLPYLFHPGDICLAGTKKDLLLLFDIPLADRHIFMNVYRACFLSFMKYVPEQYIWIKCIENKIDEIIYAGNQSYNNSVVNDSEHYYINNFLALSPQQMGFSWPKHESVYNNKGQYSVYSLNDWKKLYNKCNNKYFTVDKKKLFIKSQITIFMTLYFFVRTCILKVPLFRKIAISLFRKRG